jgi:hypothetical protein
MVVGQHVLGRSAAGRGCGKAPSIPQLQPATNMVSSKLQDAADPGLSHTENVCIAHTMFIVCP